MQAGNWVSTSSGSSLRRLVWNLRYTLINADELFHGTWNQLAGILRESMICY
ncbi:MAG: hypothetical protein ACYTF1_16295 [Planctomycetota bacterium]